MRGLLPPGEGNQWRAALTSRSGRGKLANKVCFEATGSASRTNRPCLPWAQAPRRGQVCRGCRPETAAHGISSLRGSCSSQRISMTPRPCLDSQGDRNSRPIASKAWRQIQHEGSPEPTGALQPGGSPWRSYLLPGVRCGALAGSPLSALSWS